MISTGFPLVGVAGSARFGEEVPNLLVGFVAKMGDAPREGVIPAWLVCQQESPEALHSMHQLHGLPGGALVEQLQDLTQRFTKELTGETRQFRACCRIIGIDAGDGAQDRQRAFFVTLAHGLPVVAVEWMVFANHFTVEAFDRENMLVVERKTGRQAAFTAERLPAFRVSET